MALDIIFHLNDILDIFHFRKKFQHPMIECTGDFSIDLASPNSTHATPKFFDNDKMPFIARTDKCYMYLTLFVKNLLCWSRKKSWNSLGSKKTHLPHGVIPSHVHCNEMVESNNGDMMGSCDYINSINGHLNRI